MYITMTLNHVRSSFLLFCRLITTGDTSMATQLMDIIGPVNGIIQLLNGTTPPPQITMVKSTSPYLTELTLGLWEGEIIMSSA